MTDSKQVSDTDKLLAEAIELLRTADTEGIRAKNISGHEDVAVRHLCELYGYGAVMDSAARQWYLKAEKIGSPGSSHTIGHCVLTIKDFIDRATRKSDKIITATREERAAGNPASRETAPPLRGTPRQKGMG